MEIEYETIVVTCQADNCLNQSIPIEVQAPTNYPWAGVVCGGGCGNLIHAGNDIEYEPELTVEEIINQAVEQKLRDLGVIE